ncbi:hypothetical protein AB4Z22_42585, partial [Paenibacillus sp. TAF58]
AITFAKEKFHDQMAQERAVRKQFQLLTVERERKLGDANIYFYDGSNLLGEDAHEVPLTVSIRLLLGFLRMANGLAPVLQKILTD